MYSWDCTYCDRTIQSAIGDEVKAEGRLHLQQNHRQELALLFREKWAGNDCQGGCGNYFPPDGDFSGFECPDCGHDHFNYFAGSHVWVGIEKIDT